MPTVNSTHLQQVEYDEETQQLEITFRDGQVYTYFEVPVYVYNGLISTIDTHDYFVSVIKDKFQHQR